MLKKAEFDKEVETKRAASVLAYDLQKAKTKQLIMDETSQIKVTCRASFLSIIAFLFMTLYLTSGIDRKPSKITQNKSF